MAGLRQDEDGFHCLRRRDKKRGCDGPCDAAPSAEDYLYPAFIISRLVICCDRDSA
jgi:hypothetical protein